MFCMLDQRQSADDHSGSNMSTAMLQKLKMKPKHHGMIRRHFANEISKYAKQQSLKKLLRLLRLHRSLITTILRPTPPKGPFTGPSGVYLALLRNLEVGGFT